jgi:hypothetical protein
MVSDDLGPSWADAKSTEKMILIGLGQHGIFLTGELHMVTNLSLSVTLG